MQDLEPVTFQEAWRHVMMNEAMRGWAFDSRPPTATELIRGRQNLPFCKSFFLDAPEEECFSHQQYRNRIDDVYLSVRTLRDGTRLGVVLNSRGCDFCTPVFSLFDKAYTDPSIIVNRLIASSIRGRLIVMEFAWLVSGVLSVKLHPFASLGTDPKINFRVDVFSKADASYLTTIALCGDPPEDFINGNFRKLLLVNSRYTLKLDDTAFQLSCIFCTTRGLLQCACPMPMRRRTADSNMVSAYRSTSATALWVSTYNGKKLTARRGAGIYNIQENSSMYQDKMLIAGFMPFDLDLCWNIVGNPSLHMHMASTGTTLFEPTRMHITDSTATTLQKRPRAGISNSSSHDVENTAALGVPLNSEIPGLLVGTSMQARNNGTATNSNRNPPIPNESFSIEAVTPTNTGDAITPDSSDGVRSATTAQQRASKQLRYTTHALRELEQATNNVIRQVQDQASLENSNSVIRQVQEAARAVLAFASTGGTGSGVAAAPAAGPSAGAGAGAGEAAQASAKHKCPICGLLISNRKSNLKRHIEHKHGNQRRFSCREPGCELKFHTSSNLKRHLQTVHRKNPDNIQPTESAHNPSSSASRRQPTSVVSVQKP